MKSPQKQFCKDMSKETIVNDKGSPVFTQFTHQHWGINGWSVLTESRQFAKAPTSIVMAAPNGSPWFCGTAT